MSVKFKILAILGTRPEAIKMAPVLKLLQNHNKIDIKLCVTAQHREMLDQVLNLFDLKPDFDLNIMKSGQDLTDLTSKILQNLRDIFLSEKFHLVLVHGDTTTSMAAALSAFYHKVPVAHIEAGLRTNNINSPWPEELNRQITSRISKIHFSPTNNAKQFLLNEGIAENSVIVTGNTVVDALHEMSNRIARDSEVIFELNKKFSYLDKKKYLILVTAHRRENFGDGIKEICSALLKILERDDVQIIFSVHPNPEVSNLVHQMLGDSTNLFLIPPQEYFTFIYLMNKAHIVITDSGGIQEEAPSLGKPTLVTRESTERQEAVENGYVKLVGTDSTLIVTETLKLIDNQDEYKSMSATTNPFGDGKASSRILDAIISIYNLQ